MPTNDDIQEQQQQQVEEMTSVQSETKEVATITEKEETHVELKKKKNKNRFSFLFGAKKSKELQETMEPASHKQASIEVAVEKQGVGEKIDQVNETDIPIVVDHHEEQAKEEDSGSVQETNEQIMVDADKEPVVADVEASTGGKQHKTGIFSTLFRKKKQAADAAAVAAEPVEMEQKEQVVVESAPAVEMEKEDVVQQEEPVAPMKDVQIKQEQPAEEAAAVSETKEEQEPAPKKSGIFVRLFSTRKSSPASFEIEKSKDQEMMETAVVEGDEEMAQGEESVEEDQETKKEQEEVLSHQEESAAKKKNFALPSFKFNKSQSKTPVIKITSAAEKEGEMGQVVESEAVKQQVQEMVEIPVETSAAEVATPEVEREVPKVVNVVDVDEESKEKVFMDQAEEDKGKQNTNEEEVKENEPTEAPRSPSTLKQSFKKFFTLKRKAVNSDVEHIFVEELPVAAPNASKEKPVENEMNNMEVEEVDEALQEEQKEEIVELQVEESEKVDVEAEEQEQTVFSPKQKKIFSFFTLKKKSAKIEETKEISESMKEETEIVEEQPMESQVDDVVEPAVQQEEEKEEPNTNVVAEVPEEVVVAAEQNMDEEFKEEEADISVPVSPKQKKRFSFFPLKTKKQMVVDELKKEEQDEAMMDAQQPATTNEEADVEMTEEPLTPRSVEGEADATVSASIAQKGLKFGGLKKALRSFTLKRQSNNHVSGEVSKYEKAAVMEISAEIKQEVEKVVAQVDSELDEKTAEEQNMPTAPAIEAH